MEVSFYGNEENQGTMSAVKQLKQKMTLDFANSSSTKKEKAGAAGLLASPDLNMLKLASPELERMIIAQNGMVTTTPTPTQFLCPKYVTEEQDAYARGFVDALAELYKKEMPADEAMALAQTKVSEAVPSGMIPLSNGTTLTTLQPVSTQQQPTQVTSANAFTTANGLPPMSQTQTIDISSLPVNSMSSQMIQVKEEPQTVPSLGSAPISPIDMDSQERIKLDRKRERNRMAARKCRTRKLERIARLEERVAQLKGENTDLSTTATSLRDQVARLKKQIMEHVNSGCQVMMNTQNLL